MTVGVDRSTRRAIDEDFFRTVESLLCVREVFRWRENVWREAKNQRIEGSTELTFRSDLHWWSSLDHRRWSKSSPRLSTTNGNELTIDERQDWEKQFQITTRHRRTSISKKRQRTSMKNTPTEREIQENVDEKSNDNWCFFIDGDFRSMGEHVWGAYFNISLQNLLSKEIRQPLQV